MSKYLGKRVGAKKSLVLLSVFLFLFLFAPVASAVGLGLGDVNSDGEINVIDVTWAMKHVLEIVTLSEDEEALADVNGSGDVKIVDVTLIMQYSLGIIDEFPIPATLEVTSVTAINYKEIVVTFNQAMDPITAENPNNYILSGFAAAALNDTAAYAEFTDSTNTKVRLVTKGVAITDRIATTDTAAKVYINAVNNSGLAKSYTSPVGGEALGTIADDITYPTVVSVNPLGTNHFMIEFSEAVIGSAAGTNNSALKPEAYKIETVQLSGAGATEVQITNPSGDLRNYLFSFPNTATSIVPLIGSATIWVNNHAIVNNKVYDYAGNPVPISFETVVFVEDTTRPTVSKAQIIDRQTIRVTFSEMVKDPASIALIKWGTETYALATRSANSFQYVSGTSYDIGFSVANSLPESGTFKLFIPKEQVIDLSGNQMLADYEVSLTGKVSDTMQITATGTTASVVINFSRDIAANGDITNPANYKIDGLALPAGVTPVRTNNTTVTITTPLTHGSHTVSISNLKDAFGVTIPDKTASFEVVDATIPSIIGFWYADGVMVAGVAKDVLLVQFDTPMNATSLNDMTSYKAVVAGGTVFSTAGDYPAGTVALALGGDRVARITTVDTFLPRANWVTDDFYFGRLVGTTYKGVTSAADNPLAGAHWVKNNPTLRVSLGIGDFTGAIASHNTVVLTEAVANNAVGTASHTNFTALKNGSDVVTVTGAAVSEAAVIKTGLNDTITLTFPNNTFLAGDTVDITLTAGNATTDVFGVNITGGTVNVGVTTIQPELHSAALISSTEVLLTLTGAVTDDLASSGHPLTSLGNDLILQQGTNISQGSGAGPGQITVTNAGLANGTQFILTVNAANAFNLDSPVFVKTRSSDFITTVNDVPVKLKANTTGIEFNKDHLLAAVKYDINVGDGSNLANNAFTADTVTETIDIIFNRSLYLSSISGGWVSGSHDITNVTVSQGGVLTIPGVGTFTGIYPLDRVALSGSTFVASYDDLTKKLSLTLKAADANTNKMILDYRGTTFTPVSTISSTAGATIDTTVRPAGQDGSSKLVMYAVDVVGKSSGALALGDLIRIYYNGPAGFAVHGNLGNPLANFALVDSADVFTTSLSTTGVDAAEPSLTYNADYTVWTLTIAAATTPPAVTVGTTQLTPIPVNVGTTTDGLGKRVANAIVDESAVSDAITIR